MDSPFYAPPSQRNSELWVERTPDDFIFHVKAFGLFTGHATEVRALPRDLRGALPRELNTKPRVYMKDLPAQVQRETWRRYSEALIPLKCAGKLGLLLFQFPPWFHPSRASREHILLCKEEMSGYPLTVEFRNSAWLQERDRDRTLHFLRDNGLTFAYVDGPQGFASSIPPIAVATTDVAYVRFHGRNHETWEKKGAAASERFNYYYTEQELQEWVPSLLVLRETTTATHVLFNTNYQDQGVVNARQLAGLLGEGLA